MSEIVTPKFPPSWDSWGDLCCCEKIVRKSMLCCVGDLWLVSEFGNIGCLEDGTQDIFTVGFTTSYREEYCFINNDYHAIVPSVGKVIVWYKKKVVYNGDGSIPMGISLFVPLDYGNYLIVYGPSRMVWYKDRLFYDGEDLITGWNGDYIAIGATLWFKGEIIYEGEGKNVNNVGCGDYHAVSPSSGTMILWYNGSIVYEGTADRAVFGDCSGDYFIVRRRSNSVRVLYKGEILREKTNNAWVLGSPSKDYLLLISETNSVEVFYKGELIYEGSPGQYVSGHGERDYFNMSYYTESTNTRTLMLWYKGGLFCETENYGLDSFYGDYTILRVDDSNIVAVWYQGEPIYEGPRVPQQGYQGECKGEDHYRCMPNDDTIILWYRGEKLYEGPGRYAWTSYQCCNAYVMSGDQTSNGKIWHKGRLFYEGAIAYAFCCGEFFEVIPENGSSIVFLEGNQVEYNQEQIVPYQCCSNKLILSHDDDTVDVWDASFGRMKFDMNTFDRIA